MKATMSVSSRGSETRADHSVVQRRRTDDYFQSNNEARNSVTSNTERYGDEPEIPVYDEFETSEKPAMSEKLVSSTILASDEKKDSGGLTREKSSEYDTCGFIGGLADLGKTIFVTGSSYEGTWDALGMTGVGRYVMPNGTVYEGEMRDGMFHGQGSLYFAENQRLDVVHVRGELREHKYNFNDGLSYEEENWSYCKFPDRRFYESVKNGLRPGGRTLKTAKQPTKILPAGCYDTGDGVFDPKSHFVTSYDDANKVLRSASPEEYRWIVKNCRKSWTKPTGYRPDFNENWSKNPPELPYNLPMSENSPDDWWRRLTTFAKDRSFLDSDESGKDVSIAQDESSPSPEVCMCGRFLIIGEPCRCVRASVSFETGDFRKSEISVTTKKRKDRENFDKEIFRESSKASPIAHARSSDGSKSSLDQNVPTMKYVLKKAAKDEEPTDEKSSGFSMTEISQKSGKKLKTREESAEPDGLDLEEIIKKSDSAMRRQISNTDDEKSENNAYASEETSENVQLLENVVTENLIKKESFESMTEETLDQNGRLAPREKVAGAMEPETGKGGETKLLSEEDGPEKYDDRLSTGAEEKKSRPDFSRQGEKSLEEIDEDRESIGASSPREESEGSKVQGKSASDSIPEVSPDELAAKKLKDVNEESMEAESRIFERSDERKVKDSDLVESSIISSKSDILSKKRISSDEEDNKLKNFDTKSAIKIDPKKSDSESTNSKKLINENVSKEGKIEKSQEKMDENEKIKIIDENVEDESKMKLSDENVDDESKMRIIIDESVPSGEFEESEGEKTITESQDKIRRIGYSGSEVSTEKNVISSTFGTGEAGTGISSLEESSAAPNKLVDNEGSSSTFISTRLGRVESSVAPEDDLASFGEVHPSLATLDPMKQETSEDKSATQIRDKCTSEEKSEPMSVWRLYGAKQNYGPKTKIEDLLFHPALTAPRSENVKYVKKTCDSVACKMAIREVRTAGSRTRNDSAGISKKPKQLSAPCHLTRKK